MFKDGITKDIHNIKKEYGKEKYMEYSTYIGLKYKIDELYSTYEKENKKTNRDYIIRQNRLSRNYLTGIKNFIISFTLGVSSSFYVKIIDVINESEKIRNSISINLAAIIGYLILVILFWYLAIYTNKVGINKYANKIEEYEIKLIDKILRKRYYKSKKSKKIHYKSKKVKNR